MENYIYTHKDNVKCNYCYYDGLVDKGADICPKCNKDGWLCWKDGEEKEVEIW
jgi:hypothetical protein